MTGKEVGILNISEMNWHAWYFLWDVLLTYYTHSAISRENFIQHSYQKVAGQC